MLETVLSDKTNLKANLDIKFRTGFDLKFKIPVYKMYVNIIYYQFFSMLK